MLISFKLDNLLWITTNPFVYLNLSLGTPRQKSFAILQDLL